MPLALSSFAASCGRNALTSSLSDDTDNASYLSGLKLTLPITKRVVAFATSPDDKQTKSSCADDFVDLEGLGSRRANSVFSTNTERKYWPDSSVALSVAPTPHSKPGYVALSVAPSPHSKPGYIALSVAPTPHSKPGYVALSVVPTPHSKPGYTALSVASTPNGKSCKWSSPAGGISGKSRKASFVTFQVLNTPKSAAASPEAVPSRPMFFANDPMVPMPISVSTGHQPLVGSTVQRTDIGSAVGNPITATV